MPLTSFNNLGPRVANAGGLLFKSRRTFGLPVVNKTGASIAANKLVAVSGYDTATKLPKIVLADADAANLATDVWVTSAAIADLASGKVYKGFMSVPTLDTSSVTTVGDPVFLDTVAGGFTATAPTGATARVVLVGYAQVKSASVGQIAWDIQEPQKFGSLDYSGVGFSSGGGAVTQLTSRTTGVTLNTKSGTITTSSASLAAEATADFVVTNSQVAIGDVIILAMQSGSNGGGTLVNVSVVTAGTFSIRVHNGNAAAGVAETGAILINFAVVKAVSA